MQAQNPHSSNEAIRQNYDRLSVIYDLLSLGAEKRLAKKAISQLTLKPGEHVLEVGFGTGHSLLQMQRLVGNEGFVFGIDLSPKMLIKTRKRIQAAGFSKTAALSIGNALFQAFASRSFDAMLMNFVLEILSEEKIPRVLRECARVLKPKGRLSILCMAKPIKMNLIQSAYSWAARRWPSVVDCKPIDLEALIPPEAFKIIALKQPSLWGLQTNLVLLEKII